MTAAKTNTRLPEIAKAIKALERKTIQNAVEIGKLLHEANEQCEHGEFMDWLKSNFGWSYNTLLRYRNVYDLSQNRQFGDFAKWAISISTLYLIAGNIKKYDEERRACEAIIEAAKHGRVSYRMACDIIRKCREEYEAQRAGAYDAAHPDDPAIAGDTSPQLAAPDDDEPEDDSPENDDSPNDGRKQPEEGGKADEAPPLSPDVKHDDYQAYLEEADTREPVKLLQRLDVMLRQQHHNWAVVIKAFGPVKFSEMVNTMKVELDQYSQAKADRAATRADKAKAEAAG